jgi:hypothetical protein
MLGFSSAIRLKVLLLLNMRIETDAVAANPRATSRYDYGSTKMTKMLRLFEDRLRNIILDMQQQYLL